jgi:GNAT superfamily N-acetyltransferase
LWRFRADLPGPLVRELARLAAAERAPRDLDALPEREAVLRARLAAAAPVEQVFHGAAFRFPESLVAAEESPDLVELGPGDERLVAESFPALAASLAGRAPCLAFVEAGRAVSTCYCATSATRPAAWVEAGVETLPGFRGRGLASRTLAAWAHSLRARGVVPLYSASLSNRASLGVARRLGLIRYGSVLHMR